jgi:anti-sigma factor RsiW
MKCFDFLARSSELLDGRIQGDELGEMEDHLSGCPRCRQYHSTLEQGLALLRRLPSLDVPEDFHPRLDHRIYHIEDGANLTREALGSGATTISVLAVAALLAFVAWTPRAGVGEAVVELPTIVVVRPPAAAFTPRPRRPNFPQGPSLFTTANFQDGLWGETHQLLFEYSSLSGRRRGQTLSRAALQ